MTEEDNNIVNSTMRGDNVGEAMLADDEYICTVDQDFIADSPESVYYHMLSAHGVTGSKASCIKDIEAESTYYRDHALPGYELDESDDDEVEETSGNLFVRFVNKLLNPF